jgi:hypothetical protein
MKVEKAFSKLSDRMTGSGALWVRKKAVAIQWIFITDG